MANIEPITGPMPCFRCGTGLAPMHPTAGTERYLTQPAGALTFQAYGQYGSTVFDPMDNSQLQVNICDECLTSYRERVWHVKYQRQMDRLVYMKPWDPEVEYVGLEMEQA